MRLIAVLFLSICALAQVPRQDSRLGELPGTDTHFTMPAYPTLADWEARKAQLRKQILSAAGLIPMPEKTPLHPQIFGRMENQEYSVEKVLLETRPGYYLGGNLYRPAGKSGRFPAVASPHGHWSYGRIENSALGSIPARAISLARLGFVVFTYDMVGYNDTVQTPHAFGGQREQLWSFGPLGLQLWNSIRVVDFLQSLPDVDPERIGATGASGGGTQTFLLTAVDDRVKFSAPVNMISAIMQGGCACENAPNLRVGAFNVEIGAMMAPRPLLMVSATGDWTRNTPREEFPAIQSIYKLYGKESDVETVQIDAPHNYNQQSREAVYSFFSKRVLGGTEAVKERNVRLEFPQNLLALHNRMLPSNAVSYDQLFEQWMVDARKDNDTTDPQALRERLTLALAARWPAKVLSERKGDRVTLNPAGTGERVTGTWIGGKGTPVVVLSYEGVEAARRSVPAGRPALLLDPFPAGKRDEKVRHFLCFNKTDAANQVQDILTALAWQPGAELIGTGKAAVACLFAAAVAPARVKLTADVAGFRGEDQDFIDGFFVPGIQRAGGLRAAQSLVK